MSARIAKRKNKPIVRRKLTIREKWLLAVSLALFFLIPYLAINHLPVSGKLVMLSNSVDTAIPLIPAFVIIYLSTYLFAFIPLLLIRNRRYIIRVAVGYAFVMVVSYIFFMFFPTSIIRPHLAGDGIFSKMLEFFYSVDLPHRNNFPSLHVSIALLAGLASFGYAKKYWWMLVWALAIAASTLFVKQHDLADVFAGAALAVIAHLAIIRRS